MLSALASLAMGDKAGAFQKVLQSRSGVSLDETAMNDLAMQVYSALQNFRQINNEEETAD